MVRRISRQEQRRRLLSWAKYAPAMVVFFGALWMEAYVANQLRQHDYLQNELSRDRSALEDQLIEIQVQAARFQNVDLLADQAMVLGMVEARPNQIEHITAPGYEPVSPESRSGEILARVRSWDTPQAREALRSPLMETADAAVADEVVTMDVPGKLSALQEESAQYVSPALLDEDPSLMLGNL